MWRVFAMTSCAALVALAVALHSVAQPSADTNGVARSGCCSWHGGVCGCSGGRALCCDGTLSPSCSC